MNLGAAKIALKRFGFDDGDPLVTWLNAALQNILMEHDWSWKTRVAFLPSTTDSFLSFPVSLLKDIESINSIVAYDGVSRFEKLQPMEKTQFVRNYPEALMPDATRLSAFPRNYCRFGYIIEVAPILYGTPLNYRMIYNQRYPDFADNGSVDLGLYVPDHLHYAIVLNAAAIALSAENEEERSAAAMGQYKDIINKAWGRDSGTVDDEPQQVVDVMGYSHGHRLGHGFYR